MLDEHEPGDESRAGEENGGQRSEDAAVRVGEVAAEHGDESDERGGDEDRRRADPEDPAEPDPRHAFAAAFFVATAFLTMNRSMSSRASSSRICLGGDFMR